MEALPDAELARRSAGGDGAAFAQLYDSHSAGVFEASLGETGSVDVAAAATQTAFLKLLSHPPAMGAPDAEVVDRLHALAHGAAVEGATLSRPIGGGTGTAWLRTETITKAGERFDEDWSVHAPKNGPPGEERRERATAALPLPPAFPPCYAGAAKPAPRRTLREFAADLPLRSAGVVVLLISFLTLGAAVARLNTNESGGGATPTAAAADDRKRAQNSEPKKKQNSEPKKNRRGRKKKANNRVGPPLLDEKGDEIRTDSLHHSSPRGVQRVAGQRRAHAPLRLSGGDGGGGNRLSDDTTRSDPDSTSTPDPAPAPEPAPAPAPEPAPAPAPAPEDTSGQGKGKGHVKEPKPDDGHGGPGPG